MTGGNPPFWGNHVLQKIAAPTKIESCVTRSNISKNQTYTPFLQKMALKLITCDQGVVWNGMENEMKWNGNFGMENGRCQNGMEDFKNEMEDNLPYFHTNFILDFAHGIYRKVCPDSDN